MKTNNFLIALVFGVFIFSACGNDKATSAQISEPIPVKLNSGKADHSSPFVSASGKIEAVNSANLSTRMMGFVNKIYVKVGQKVNKGHLLIAINNSDLQAQRAQVNAKIAEAQVAYNNAKKDYQRYKNLFASSSASQKEMDNMTANFEMARARLEAAIQTKSEIDAQFAYVNIRAPFSGVVTNVFIDEGDMANPGITLVSVEGQGQFEVSTLVPESEISQIVSGSEVDVEIRSINQKVKGKVTEVSTSAKNTGGQYQVKVLLDKENTEILSGMYATVQFPVEKKSDTTMVLLPESAIVTKGQLSGVYTVSEQQTALLRWLRLGRTYGNMVEVLSGLSADESYIISADGKLYNGAKVSIE